MPPKDDLKKKTVKVSDLDRVRSPAFVEAYSNNVNGAAGFHELRLIFGQIVTDLDKPRIEDRAAVTMTWEHARDLRDLLDRLVKRYEEEHGPLREQSEE
jgi:hypothetical protein